MLFIPGYSLHLGASNTGAASPYTDLLSKARPHGSLVAAGSVWLYSSHTHPPPTKQEYPLALKAGRHSLKVLQPDLILQKPRSARQRHQWANKSHNCSCTGKRCRQSITASVSIDQKGSWILEGEIQMSLKCLHCSKDQCIGWIKG